jgi:hypothetical protein
MLSQIFPMSAFGMGLTARTAFVYSNEAHKVSPFSSFRLDEDLESDLLSDLRRVANLVGPFKVHEEAVKLIEDWWLERSEKDKPRHPKLEGYNGKRILHLFRLCMVHCASRADHMVIEARDVNLALHDLLEVESVMPMIFDEMLGEGSSTEVIADVMHELIRHFKADPKPIPYYVVSRAVAKRVKAYEIDTVIDSLVAQKFLKEVEPKLKVPGATPRAFIPTEIVKDEVR